MKLSLKMGKNLFVVVILCVSQLCLFALFSKAQIVKVGLILDLNSSVGRIGFTSLQLAQSDFYQNHPNYSTRIQLFVSDSSTGVTAAAASALDLLKTVQVDAIIGPQKSAQAAFLIDLANAANVPVVSFSATSPSLPAQSPYFVQTGVNDAAQVDAIAAVLENFRWTQVVLVYEDSDYGSGIIPYLSNAFQEVNARVSSRCVIPVSASDDLILRELYKMKTLQVRVFVVHISTTLASRFFLRVKEAEMMSEGYAWIVTSGLMDLFHSLDPRVVESMQGVVGVKPLVPDSEELQSFNVKSKQKLLRDYPRISPGDEMNIFGLWAYDTLWALALAAERVGSGQQSWIDSNSKSMFITQVSRTGPKLLQEVVRSEFQGLSGEFRLTNRQLDAPPFQIVNVVGGELREVGIWNTASPSSTLALLKGTVSWPGGEAAAPPKGWELPVSGRKLRVGVPAVAGFPEFVKVEKDPQTNATKISGYFIDVFDAVMAALPYAVRYEYVSFETTNASVIGTYYDELTRQVSIGNFDVAVGDITITAFRSQYVDFSFPVEEGGVTRTEIVKYSDPYEPSVFLSPLETELWVTVIALVVLTGVALWILEREINEAFSVSGSEQAGLILFIPFASLLLANGERIATNLGRVVMVTFLFAALILNSTYTANLSAILTAGRIQKNEVSISTLIKNGDYVGYREGSFIGSFLTTRLGFDENRTRPYKDGEGFATALSNGSITAFFSCTPYTNMFLSKFCTNKFRKVGPTFLSEGYAIAFPKGSPMVADVSRAIVELMDDRRIEDIKGRWFRHSACSDGDNTNPDDEGAGKKIRLRNFAVLFGISAGVTAACVACYLAFYLSNSENRDSIRDIFESSDTTTSKIRRMCKHLDQRDASMARRTPDKSDVDENH